MRSVLVDALERQAMMLSESRYQNRNRVGSVSGFDCGFEVGNGYE